MPVRGHVAAYSIAAKARDASNIAPIQIAFLNQSPFIYNMAVPADLTLRNFYGTFEMNKTLSDETDKVLQLVWHCRHLALYPRPTG